MHISQLTSLTVSKVVEVCNAFSMEGYLTPSFKVYIHRALQKGDGLQSNVVG